MRDSDVIRTRRRVGHKAVPARRDMTLQGSIYV